MKKKFRLWLNIVTICLCICAIAIGVYAATSATLTVSGQIGFKAHGCEGTVSGTIVGHAIDDNKDAMPTTTPVSLGDAVDFGQTLSYGTSRYFTDMATTDGSVTPITIVLTVTNKSLYPIEGQLVLPETDFAKAIDFDVESGLVQLAAANTTDDTDVGTITITMKLKSTTTNYADPVALNFTIEFNKYEQIKGDATNGYYMTMGSNVVTDENDVQQVQPVKWIPFAESSDGETWTAFVNTNKPDTSKQYYFISEKVLDVGSVKTTGTGENMNTQNSGVSFNNNYVVSGNYSDKYYTILPAHNYINSNARKFLNSTSNSAVSKGAKYSNGEYIEDGVAVNLLTEYGLTGYVFNKIQGRNIEDLYELDKPQNSFETIAANSVCAPLVTGDYAKDKLWLLSGNELKLVLNDNDYNFLGSTNLNLVAKTFRQNINSYWWLRTPEAYTLSSVYAVTNKGYIGSYSSVRTAVDYQLGIRPAFQIDLSK